MKKVNVNLDEQLKSDYARWEYLYTYGGQDPFWSDGCNLDLVRNHIIATKKEMEESGQLTPTYYIELPPVVDRDYMACADEIRNNARKSLDAYQNHKDYKYLIEAIGQLSKKEIDDTSINYVIGYASGLKNAIEKDDLISMRRHRDASTYIASFTTCKEKIERIIKERPRNFFYEATKQIKGQFSIMDLIEKDLEQDDMLER
jgi:hypothetical protein